MEVQFVFLPCLRLSQGSQRTGQGSLGPGGGDPAPLRSLPGALPAACLPADTQRSDSAAASACWNC